VSYILISTASHNDPFDEDWQINGAKLLVSHKYGFGVVNASAAITLAMDAEYLRVHAPFGVTIIRAPSYRTITYNHDTFIGEDSYFFQGRHEMGAYSMSGRVLSVQVRVTITHPSPHHLKIVLMSPSGTTSILANNRLVEASDVRPYKDFTMSSLRHWGEDPRGNWTLIIQDVLNGEITDPKKVSLQWYPIFYISAFEIIPSPSPTPTPTPPPTPTPFIHTNHNGTLDWVYNDPFYPDQWHLHDPLGGVSSPFNETRCHINVFPVWKSGHTGQGVIIAVLDDGIDRLNPDLETQFSVLTSCDTSTWGDVKKGPHGTLISSLSAANANNEFCGLGMRRGKWEEKHLLSCSMDLLISMSDSRFSSNL
jgi:subtilisin family serine protease